MGFRDRDRALRSGVLAARSVLDGADYAERAAEEFDAARAASVVNRTALEAMPQRLFDRAVRVGANGPDLAGRLRRHGAPNRMISLLAPRLAGRYRDRIHPIDRACHDPGCRCLRCRCGDEIAGAPAVLEPGGRRLSDEEGSR